jgi:hypothetical protein
MGCGCSKAQAPGTVASVKPETDHDKQFETSKTHESRSLTPIPDSHNIPSKKSQSIAADTTNYSIFKSEQKQQESKPNKPAGPTTNSAPKLIAQKPEPSPKESEPEAQPKTLSSKLEENVKYSSNSHDTKETVSDAKYPTSASGKINREDPIIPQFDGVDDYLFDIYEDVMDSIKQN